MRTPTIILISLILLVGFLAYRIELTFPGTPPSIHNTYTPLTQSAPEEINSYDVLGYPVSKQEAASLLQTESGRKQLSPENGAVEITEDLLALGRNAFYTETFGNETFITDVTGVLQGPLNIWNLTKAILALKGQPTTNLQVPLTEDITVGGQTFTAGTKLNTGLDVAVGSLVPIGIRTHIGKGKVRIGVTCAMCHASVDAKSGRVLEGAPNNDLDTGLILAMASNSAAWFRQTGINPTRIPPGQHAYINAEGQEARLPDLRILEEAVDAQLLSWPPGNFDSSGDINNNPAQIPSSYTHEAWPYGWSGFASVGWFHGLTTLNSNVHAVNSDLTTGADASEPLLGIDKEIYLGTMLQNAANPRFRLPEGAKPSEFFDKIDPTPGTPGINEVVPMPGYPKGSIFILDGLMAGSPGLPVGAQLNGMSAFQNTLAPPPNLAVSDAETLQRGAKVFSRASCVECHSGRYFTNHEVIPQPEIGTQPSRAKALAKFPRVFDPPQTYPNSVSAPVPPDSPVLSVPTDITPQRVKELAYAQSNPAGGYKVPSLIGLHVTAPYLHDGGVAAGPEAFKREAKGDRYTVTNPNQLGIVGTSLQGIQPDPSASLRVLLDRSLRKQAVTANRSNYSLQQANVDGSGHPYWVDKRAGFTLQDQDDLIQFLLSLDDDPVVLQSS